MKEPPQVDPSIIDDVLAVPFETRQGMFFVSAFRVNCGTQTTECASLHVGDVSRNETVGVPVRIHSGCLTGEVFGAIGCDCAWQLQHALDLIAAESKGVLVYLPSQEGRGNGLVEKIRSFRLMNEGLSSSQAFAKLGIPMDARGYAPAMAVLRRLRVQRLRLVTNNPLKLNAVLESGFNVVGRIPSIIKTKDKALLKYLESKRTQLGHLIEAPK